MKKTTEDNNLESRIIKIARETFIEKGFAETSMSEIATRVGINRPVLHYYFRTKDKLFQSVFGDIVLSIAPKIFDTLVQKDKTIAERIEEIVDAYYLLFLKNPQLPMFVLREINRDANFLIKTAIQFKLVDRAMQVWKSLEDEMNNGILRKVSFRFMLFNMYGLLTMPFLTKKVSFIYLKKDESFENMLEEWKSNIIFQMQNLLSPE